MLIDFNDVLFLSLNWLIICLFDGGVRISSFFQCRIVQTRLYFVNMSGAGGRRAGVAEDYKQTRKENKCVTRNANR